MTKEKRYKVKVSKQVKDAIVKALRRYHPYHYRIGYLVGRISGSEIVVSRVVVPKQKSTPLSTEIPPKSTLEAAEKEKKLFFEGGNGKEKIIGLATYIPAFLLLAESSLAKKSRHAIARGIGYKIGLFVNGYQYKIYQD